MEGAGAGAGAQGTCSRSKKRIILCCDGTWENSTGPSVKPLTNVTRLSRSLKQICTDGTHQVIYYHPGVGTGGRLNALVGGAFGIGLGADIREAYNYVCTNYVDGDDIVLIGFSRGAFTARSTADLIASIGLLDIEAMTNFYPIFEDYEHMADEHRSDEAFLDDSAKFLTKYNGEKGKAKILWENKRKDEYRDWLIRRHWTRNTFKDGSTLIRIKAVAVWDTVGSLGIPPIPVIGIQGSASQWKFTNTQISSKVEYAFQALAMDEPRSSFRPALWERLEGNTTTYLKQVWFPGTHANIGGGWYDQQIASITLAWICDQLTPLGVEFNPHSLTRLFYSSLRYSAAHPYPSIPSPSIFIPSFIWSIILRYRIPIPWAFTPKPCPPPKSTQRIDQANCTDDDHHPHGSPEQLWKFHGRPWGLGQTRFPTSWFQLAGGTVVRRPGCYMRVDPDNNKDTTEPLLNTNERVHSCVRLRLRLGGMSPDDRQTWPCASLLEDDSHGEKPVWRLERGKTISQRELDQDTAFWDSELADDKKDYDSREIYNMQDGDGDWNWVFEDDAVIKNSTGETVRPLTKVLPEEPLVGYWERCLLALTRGELDDWRLGEEGVPGTVNGGKFV